MRITKEIKKDFDGFWGLAYDLLDYETEKIGEENIGQMNYIVAVAYAAMLWSKKETNK